MKTRVRYDDPHVPWLPKPDMTKVVRKACWSDGFRLPRESKAAPVDIGDSTNAIREFLDGQERVTRHGGKPHPWEDRRKDVIEQFDDRIIRTATPVGYEDAWSPDQRFDSPEAEWKWIEATADNELAPDWLTLRVNGIRGESLDALQQTDDGEYTLHDVAGWSQSGYLAMRDWEEAFELLGGMRRVEAFLKEQDERQWQSGHPKRYALVVNDAGKRGFVPMSRATKESDVERYMAAHRGQLPDIDDAIRAMEHRNENIEVYTDESGRRRRRMKPGTYSSREDMGARALHRTLDAIEAERDEQEWRIEEANEYKPNSPCPNSKCEERGDDCPLCFGERYILHTIGSTLDWPPPGYVEESASTAIKHHRKSREAIKRLRKDIRDLTGFTPRRFKGGVKKSSDKSLDSLPF